jgi:type VI protein secretion system component VasK
MEVLWIAALAWVQKRRHAASRPEMIAAAVERKLTPKIVVAVLLFWVAVTSAFAIWAIGPSGPVSPRNRTILIVACFAIATLVVILVDVYRKARREKTQRGTN